MNSIPKSKAIEIVVGTIIIAILIDRMSLNSLNRKNLKISKDNLMFTLKVKKELMQEVLKENFIL